MGIRFVRLAIAGFKSFAEAASIEILPGLTGIVGPNGCGKSNVAEALRWTMGEANPRHLRGGEMDDVIFAGTANRPSRSLAEVSLAIEADGTQLPHPFERLADVSVTRRIERGAGSHYRVNGREARARDVQTLFADMASGARSSAMVSQGRVGALVTARPEDRRIVLEEAAGITGLHARRAEAETRLRAAESNLERAEDRRALLETQSAGLRSQAKQAARYRTVTQAALETEALLLAIKRARTHAERQKAGETLEDARASLAQAMESARSRAAVAAAAAGAIPQLRTVEASARASLERARIAEEGVIAEATRATSALQTASDRLEQVARDLQHALSILADAETVDLRLANEAAGLHAEQASYSASFDAALLEASNATTALVQADHLANAATLRAAEAAGHAAALRQAAEHAAVRARRVSETMDRLDAERNRAAAQSIDADRLRCAAEASADAERVLLDARAGQDAAETHHAAAAAAAATARDEVSRLDAIRFQLRAEVSALSEVLAVGDGEAWAPMVDRLTVPAGLEAALGAVLGEELGASDDVAAARHWRPLPPIAMAAPPGRAIAAEISAPSLLERALAGVALVATEAEGDAAQSGLHPGQCVVSRDGAVWRWDGYTVRAGTPTRAAVRLQQRNRLAEVDARHQVADLEAAKARTEWEAAAAAERAALSALQAARTGRGAAETSAERARANARHLQAQAHTAAARIDALDLQLADLRPEYQAAMDAREKTTQDHAAAPDSAALRDAAEAARAAVTTARARETQATRAVDDLRRAHEARQTRLHHIARERDDRRVRAGDLAERTTDLAARQTEAEAEHARLSAAPAQVEAAVEQARQSLRAAVARHATAAGALEQAEADAARHATALRDTEHAVFAAREAAIRAEASSDAATQAWSVTTTHLAEREGALPPLPADPPATPEAEARAHNRWQRLIRERDEIGPVNLRADIEADAIAADIATIETERNELATAIAKLRGSIGHLNREGRERLATVFQTVDRHFQALFTRLFGGGRAHLALVGSDDPLQAGLEIYAQPPGKKLAALSLLSGGEQALTALSLIFAIFLCNPAPLCVLDEVDAPLDDANVERFCDLLAAMATETGTRFLVVTHHQFTMARMDRLYGVTMQERGVSRLLSVDLRQAARMIEAVAAE